MQNYPSTIEEDRELLLNHHNDVGEALSNTMLGAVSIRLREKEMLDSTLEYLHTYEVIVRNNSIDFQLEMKQIEREEADIKENARQEFIREIRERAAVTPPLANIEVNMGESFPKANLTIQEGQDLRRTGI